MIPLVALSILTGVPALDALLGDEASFRTDGATIRLVAERPTGDGRIRGAVLFDLEPGWKTYWIDPGEAGLAPNLRFEIDGTHVPATLGFPAPIRFEEGGSSANGYDAPLAIAFGIEGSAAGKLSLALSAGLCLDLCVPVSAELSTDLGEPLAAGDRMAVERAFEALPDERGAQAHGVVEGAEIVVQAPGSSGRAGDLFVEGGDGWSFGASRNEGSVWRVPILARPDATADAPPFRAVIADGGRGETIRIELP